MSVSAAVERSNLRTAGLAAVAAALVGFGLWMSYSYTRVLWGPDADTYVTVALWPGVRQYGLGFVSTWTYTQDNWLFSLIAPAAGLFEAFGPGAAVLLGWIYFLVSAALTGWLTAQLAGWRAGLVAGTLLLFANLAALGPTGYLTYPISHAVSMPWGLASIAFALIGLRRQAMAPFVVVAFTLFLNAVSDPWAGAAIAAPLIVAGAVLAVMHRGSRLGACALALSIASALALLAARTRLFGLLGFLPQSHFEFGDLPTMLSNLYWAYRAGTTMFNIVPGASLETTLPRIVDLVVIVAVFGCAAVLTLRRMLSADLTWRFIGGVSLLSLGAIGFLFVAGKWHTQGLLMGRFLPNFYFLAVMLAVAVAADGWRRWGALARSAAAACAGLFILAGVASGPDAWTGKRAPASPDAAISLGEFLQAHGLKYGYGPFWGTGALMMDSLTGGAVTIRPVTFWDGHIKRRGVETSSHWFEPGDEPVGGRRFIIVKNDGEECLDLDACVAAAEAQFGPPAERLIHDGSIILVWPGSILERMGK